MHTRRLTGRLLEGMCVLDAQGPEVQLPWAHVENLVTTEILYLSSETYFTFVTKLQLGR